MRVTRRVLGVWSGLGLDAWRVPMASRRVTRAFRQPPRPDHSATSSASSPSDASPLRLKACLVSLIHDVEVPAREAGVLTKIEVREGQEVKADQQMAQDRRGTSDGPATSRGAPTRARQGDGRQ